MILTKIGIV